MGLPIKSFFLITLVMLAFAPAFAQPLLRGGRRLAQAPLPAVEVSSEKAAEPSPLALSEEDQKILSRMTLQQKIGQLLLIGFMGDTIDDGVGETISRVKPGGLILFSRNIHSAPQVVALTMAAQKEAQKFSRVPLLIGVDQEGGSVIRIKTNLPLPSALAFGDAGDPKIVQAAGLATGQLLKVLGINMDFAPVLDIADPNKPSFIGTRTYGSDPKLVAQMGGSFSEGLQQAGVMPTGKHFPGHGGIDEDSHKGTPEKSLSLEELESGDLIPFSDMKSRFSDSWAVMLGHIAYPKIDASGMPATFSKPIVKGLLRDRMGFNGLIITDDIEMGGAFAIENVHERALRAIEAGADMVMVAWNKKIQREFVSALMGAVKSGRIPLARIEESVKRILIAKRRYAQPRAKEPTHGELRLALQNPKFAEVAQRAMTAKFEKPAQRQEIDFKEFAANKPLFVFSANQRFSENFKQALHKRPLRFYGLDPERPDLIDRAMRANPKAIGVFYVSSLQVAKIVNKISDDVARRMLVVTVEAQGVIKNSAHFGYMADVYYRHPLLGKMIADHYFSETTEPRVPAASKESRPMSGNSEPGEAPKNPAQADEP